MLNLNKQYDFKYIENKWQKIWPEQGLYKWDSKASRDENFVVDTPPPTVSGQLHMGHIFSYTQTDFIVRFQRMIGKNIFYPMGFDDNGLPTERLVEKKHKIQGNKLERSEFTQKCFEVISEEEEKFKQLFMEIGLSVDWDYKYQTISTISQTLSQMSFLDLVNKNQIYRAKEPILWDPIDQTALSQADIEDKELPSYMNEIIFETEQGKKLHIATTRPEMLPACVAVFFNPEDARYKDLEGSYATSPLFNVKIPIIADDAVSIEKGTGLVMCCTFGDTLDVTWWKKYKLPICELINKYGKIKKINFGENCKDIKSANDFLELIIDKKVMDARNIIIDLLKKKQLLIKEEAIIHSVKCAERSGGPLEIIAGYQWFVKTLDYKEILLKRADEINWYPKYMKQRLHNWINSLAWDWCISRQRYFGVAFPVWYSKRKGEEGKVIFANINQLPVDPLKNLPEGYSREEVEADTDVMDTWATSAISPQLSSHAISDEYYLENNHHEKLFPADLRPQAHEIIRTWAFYTILKSHLHENTIPWKNIMISGWCLADDKSKMSKSKGNIIDPKNLINIYGADVVRYWAANSRLGADTAYSEELLKDGKRLVNKLWNAANFVNIHFNQISNFGENILEAINSKVISNKTDLWIISKLHMVIKNCKENFTSYEYAIALESLENFFWKDFCDNYLELVKVRTYNQDNSDKRGQESAIVTLYWSFRTILKLFAPIIPYVTDELFSNIFSSDKSIHSRFMWPDHNLFSYDTEIIEQGGVMIEALEIVRKFKAERNLSIKAPMHDLNIKSPIAINNDMLLDLKNTCSIDKNSKNYEEKLDTKGKNISVEILF